jgi:SAM-dependent methyltransferase
MKLTRILCAGLLIGSTTIKGDEQTERSFNYIYEHGLWGRDQHGNGMSGSGSILANAAPYIVFLQNFLKANQIRSVVDVGCGDWTFSRYIQWEAIKYTGIDIVKNVIQKNQQTFSKPTIQFIHADGTTMNLPEADLLICKDVLQHLSNEKIAIFLKQIGKFKHCLITNDVDPHTWTSDNKPIISGGWRFVDLTQPPFNLQGTKIMTYRSAEVLKQVLYIKRTDWLQELFQDLIPNFKTD